MFIAFLAAIQRSFGEQGITGYEMLAGLTLMTVPGMLTTHQSSRECEKFTKQLIPTTGRHQAIHSSLHF
jgi:hypothetical protein